MTRVKRVKRFSTRFQNTNYAAQEEGNERPEMPVKKHQEFGLTHSWR